MRPNTVVKAQHASYQTRVDGYRNLWIQNITNTLGSARPKNLNCQIQDYRATNTAKAFEQALGLERLRELDYDKERLSTNFILSAEGKILEVEFVTDVTSLITAHEIEALETALKETLTFQINWLDDNEADFVTLSTALPYNSIVSILSGRNIPQGTQSNKISVTAGLPLPSVPDSLR